MNNLSFEKELKKSLSHTFKAAIDYLNRNNFTWWCAYGTLLGAIRHNGFIPWDDDIDIFMPREDYRRLIQSKGLLQEYGLSLISEYDSGYNMPYAKIYNSNTTVLEKLSYPFIMGIYIDVFPLDNDMGDKTIINNKFLQLKHLCSLYGFSLAKYSFREMISDFGGHHLGAVYFGIKSLFYSHRNTEKYKAQVLDYIDGLSKSSGSLFVSYTDITSSNPFIAPIDWFMDTIDVDFDGYKVRVPSKYDLCLKTLYGDYMALPPENERVAHHAQHYLNLRESIDLSEVLLRIKKGIRVEF